VQLLLFPLTPFCFDVKLHESKALKEITSGDASALAARPDFLPADSYKHLLWIPPYEIGCDRRRRYFVLSWNSRWPMRLRRFKARLTF
jgi:hypothetical protein